MCEKRIRKIRRGLLSFVIPLFNAFCRFDALTYRTRRNGLEYYDLPFDNENMTEMLYFIVYLIEIIY